MMKKLNTVINGTYKGYKIVCDKSKNNIQLQGKKDIIILNDRISSICITNETLGDENVHYFEMKETNEKIYCLLDFETYLILIMVGMQIPEKCIG